jgi:hypothetical protein
MITPLAERTTQLDGVKLPVSVTPKATLTDRPFASGRRTGTSPMERLQAAGPTAWCALPVTGWTAGTPQMAHFAPVLVKMMGTNVVPAVPWGGGRARR